LEEDTKSTVVSNPELVWDLIPQVVIVCFLTIYNSMMDKKLKLFSAES